MPRTATADRVSREQLLAFLRARSRALLTTRRTDGGPQLSPVAAGVDAEGRIVVSTYPSRAKVRNVLLRVGIDRWGPVATGGFPPEVDAGPSLDVRQDGA